jgi:hypothetical protein
MADPAKVPIGTLVVNDTFKKDDALWVLLVSDPQKQTFVGYLVKTKRAIPLLPDERVVKIPAPPLGPLLLEKNPPSKEEILALNISDEEKEEMLANLPLEGDSILAQDPSLRAAERKEEGPTVTRTAQGVSRAKKI